MKSEEEQLRDEVKKLYAKTYPNIIIAMWDEIERLKEIISKHGGIEEAVYNNATDAKYGLKMDTKIIKVCDVCRNTEHNVVTTCFKCGDYYDGHINEDNFETIDICQSCRDNIEWKARDIATRLNLDIKHVKETIFLYVMLEDL
ncbi:hypothetical protein [Desulfoplanes formicivorans]|uniref:Uncharacterized protein n=1 Tax=Desulfoplanes formicivorans TaxID=1592317 RepID=A0A194AGA4_9BACT|nr:hypothetical protein [Desulfoplanes formicivorans]GAU08116.1 hypothetical protein DPF_0819 [Desulfoplanes formicivorans]